jgi:uncharacterized coiled-coil DUF342 family protein
MSAITQSDVTQALNSMREAMNTLARAIEAQSTQVRELAEENQRLHDTVKNRDETIAYMRDKTESLKQANIAQYNQIAEVTKERNEAKSELERSKRDVDELLKANLEASDEIRGLRQLILEVTLTTAKANELGAGAKPKPEAPIPTPTVPQLPSATDPASTFGG